VNLIKLDQQGLNEFLQSMTCWSN